MDRIEQKNKKIRFVSYLVLIFSIFIIGGLGYTIYKITNDNIALKEQMEQIIESHEETTIVNNDYQYNDYLVQDSSISTANEGKVLVQFPNSK